MTTKVMVSFPEEFLAQVDAVAEAEHRSRSELVREALRQYMTAREAVVRPGERPNVQAAIRIQDEISRAAPGSDEDGAELIRYWRDQRK